MAKSVTELELKVTADAKSAVRGLDPLETSLKEVKESSEDAERALSDLSDKHVVDMDTDEVKRAKDEVERLRREMREQLRMDIGADTREAQRKIRGLQSTIRLLEQTTDLDIDADVDLPRASLIAKAAVLGEAMGGALGTGLSLGVSTAVAAGVGLGVVGLGAGLAGLQVLKLSDRMAQAKIAFTQFLGSGKEARTFLSDLQQFAAKTPFEFPELVESSKTLLAFGIDAEDIVDIMTTLGDAAALTGGSVEDLTTIWGQMQAKGKVANEELLQLTEHGIPGYQMLADAMGKTVPEIQEMATKGELLSKDVLPLLQQQMNDTFGGGMAKQAETLGGKFSTLMDTLSAFGTTLGDAITPFADALIKELQPALEDVSQWAKENKGEIALVVTGLTAAFLDLGAAAINVFASIIDAQEFVQNKLGDFLIGFGAALKSLPGIPDSWGDSVIDAGLAAKNSAAGLGEMTDGMHDLADTMHVKADDVREAGRTMAEGFKGDEIAAKIQRIQDHLDNLRKKPPSPEVDANIHKAEERLKRLKKRLDNFKTEKHTANLDVQVDKANRKVNQIQKTLAYLKSKPTSPVIDAKIEKWRDRLKEVRGNLKTLRSEQQVALDVDLKPGVVPNENQQAKNTLDDTADPRGRGRVAPIKPTVDSASKHKAEGTLTTLSADRVMYVDVYYRTHNLPGAPGEGGGGGDGAGLLTLGPTATTLVSGGSGGGSGGSGSGGGGGGGGGEGDGKGFTAERTTLFPKTQPVQVFVDGVEVAKRIEARRSLVATTSVRRSA